jgi:TRAP-type C4-dicarboxylate transport system substrate-binding protein
MKFKAQHAPQGRLRKASTAVALAATVTLMLGACAGGVVGTESDDAEGEVFEFTLATGAAVGTPNAAVQEWYLDEIEAATAGRIVFDRTAPESLCKAAEVVDCVRDGRAQIGVTIPDYTPQYFPTVSVVGIPFLGQNSQAIMASFADLHNNYAPAKALMTENGLHHVATWPVGRFLLGSNEEITSVEGLAGLQVRASGPVVQQVLSDTGVSIAAITASETYEAVERGVVDSVGGAIDFPVNYRLMELLPYWTDPGIGQYSSFGMWFSVEAYESLPDDLAAIVDDVTNTLNSGAGIAAFNDVAAGQCQQLLDATTVKGVTAWTEESTSQWSAEIGSSAEARWLEIASEYNIDDPAALLAEYKAGLSKYADAEYVDATIDCVDQFASR